MIVKGLTCYPKKNWIAQLLQITDLKYALEKEIWVGSLPFKNFKNSEKCKNWEKKVIFFYFCLFF